MKKHFTIKTGLFVLLGGAVLALVCYNMRDRIFGTPFTIATAHDGATLTSPFLSIAGTARHARALLIDGRSVTVDRDGVFDDEVVLSPGYNIVEVAVQDQFGKERVRTYHLVVTAPPSTVAIAKTPSLSADTPQ